MGTVVTPLTRPSCHPCKRSCTTRSEGHAGGEGEHGEVGAVEELQLRGGEEDGGRWFGAILLAEDELSTALRHLHVIMQTTFTLQLELDASAIGRARFRHQVEDVLGDIVGRHGLGEVGRDVGQEADDALAELRRRSTVGKAVLGLQVLGHLVVVLVLLGPFPSEDALAHGAVRAWPVKPAHCVRTIVRQGHVAEGDELA